MSDVTDIEKKSLEAHVELCAERYNALETRISHVDNKIVSLEKIVREVHDMIQKMSEKRNDQIIGWGIGIITMLTGLVGWLLSQYLFK
jgi:predicted  nucleic acid-binding Zn-ribbon protein